MNRRLSFDDVKSFIESKGCILLDKEYKNNAEILNIKCRCGNDFTATFGTFRKGQQQCKECGMKIRSEKRIESTGQKHEYYSIDKIKNIINEYDTETELVSTEYSGCYSKLKWKCSCGKEFKQSFSHVKNKINNNIQLLCPDCMKLMANQSFRYSEDDINKKIFDKYGYQKFIIYDYENYTNNHNKNIYIHVECGHKFTSNLSNILLCGRLCPECEIKYSKGMYNIIKYLKSNLINYELEKKFIDCKYERSLPFDVYLPHYNALIEYDGEQHERPTELYGGQEGLELIQLRDNIKNEYCKEKDIPLLRISHRDNDRIDNLINKFIDKLIPR